MTSFARAADLLAVDPGADLGVSRWITISQDRINQFAQCTEDDQWIHVDADRARSGPYGGTIAHGYLTLSLAATMLTEVIHVGGIGAAVNYGANKVRFPNPVPVGAKVRGHVRLGATSRRGEMIEACYALTVEIQGATKPACVAELVVLYT
ncbi:MaoC family dehydratase [Microlunatus ginsengisoli]|uniref:MaoC family dehydratase n=1 Tax=Microlunatus ginsengisoli TaxID=363863 RepID=A0ABP7AWA8_9ACTN